MKYLIFLFLFVFFLFQTACSTMVPQQAGVASWYGKDFHGKVTANGERYNMYAMTAAHRTLPLGTIVKVVNTSNKKKVKVRINDRGPYVDSRIIDLSYAAAKKLDMLNVGIIDVKISILEKKGSPYLLKEVFLTRDEQIGPASWYGKSFHGKLTASGERYNMYAMTAAHRTLPFGTLIKVTNVSNRKKVKVRINDRDSRKSNRVINLSYAAAKKLKILEAGISEIKIDILK